jgi:hypothetical protein
MAYGRTAISVLLWNQGICGPLERTDWEVGRWLTNTSHHSLHCDDFVETYNKVAFYFDLLSCFTEY